MSSLLTLCVFLNTLYQLSSPFCLYLAPWTTRRAAAFDLLCTWIDQKSNDIASGWVRGDLLCSVHAVIARAIIALRRRLPQCFYSWVVRPRVRHDLTWNGTDGVVTRFDSIHTYIHDTCICFALGRMEIPCSIPFRSCRPLSQDLLRLPDGPELYITLNFG